MGARDGTFHVRYNTFLNNTALIEKRKLCSSKFGNGGDIKSF